MCLRSRGPRSPRMTARSRPRIASRAHAIGRNSSRRRAISTFRSRTWCLPTSTAISASSPRVACRCASPRTTSRALLRPPAGMRATTGWGGFRSRSCRRATTRKAAASGAQTRRSRRRGMRIRLPWNGSRRTARIALPSCSRRPRSIAWRALRACRATWCRCRCARRCRGCSRPSRAAKQPGAHSIHCANGTERWRGTVPSRSSRGPGGASSRGRCTETSSGTCFALNGARAPCSYRACSRGPVITSAGATIFVRLRSKAATSCSRFRSTRRLPT